MRSIRGALARPSSRSTTRLPFTSASVGTVSTPKRSASSGCSVTSIEVTRSRARSLRARWAIRLSIRRAGPEWVAPKKTNKGRVSSVIVTLFSLQKCGLNPSLRAASTLSARCGRPTGSGCRSGSGSGSAGCSPRSSHRVARWLSWSRWRRPGSAPGAGGGAAAGTRGRGGGRLGDRRLARGGGGRDWRRTRDRDRRDPRRRDPEPRRHARRDGGPRRARLAPARRPRTPPGGRLPRGGRAPGRRRAGAPPVARALRRPAQPRARLTLADRKKLILVVIDGLTPEVFEDAVEHESAPAIAFLARHGSYRRGVSTFPSLTPVCLSSIATGAHPDVHRIPHLVWWHRGEQRLVEYGSSFAAIRAAGMRRSIVDSVFNMNEQHLGRDAVTVYEALEAAGLTTAAGNITCYP